VFINVFTLCNTRDTTPAEANRAQAGASKGSKMNRITKRVAGAALAAGLAVASATTATATTPAATATPVAASLGTVSRVNSYDLVRGWLESAHHSQGTLYVKKSRYSRWVGLNPGQHASSTTYDWTCVPRGMVFRSYPGYGRGHTGCQWHAVGGVFQVTEDNGYRWTQW
jgi:hypothetical protein